MNWTTRSEAPRGDLSFPRAVAFSTVSMPLMALTIAITVHLPAYLATSVGIPMTTVAAAFFFCRIVDIPVEPVLGVLMDRTRTRIGRYRVWALIGAPLLMGGFTCCSGCGPRRPPRR